MRYLSANYCCIRITYIALLWVNLYTVYNNMFRCVKLGGGNTCKRILELLISRANSFHGVWGGGGVVKENIIKNRIKKFSFLFLNFPVRIRRKSITILPFELFEDALYVCTCVCL